MPDALSKTIPIWCAVVNSFLFPDASRCHVLHTPPQVVSQTEHAQISALLPSFLLALQALNLPLDNIKSQISKPLRPIWVTPESNISPTPTIFEDYHPIICCTVSRRVLGAEVSEGGYIQGAGDDTENWAHGLTPLVFWANRQVLLSTPESNLVESIEKMLASTEAITSMGHGLRSLNPCSQLLVGALCAAPPDQESDNLTIALHPQISDQSLWKTSPTRLDVGIGPHKLGSRNLRSALPLIVDFVEESLSKSTSHQIIVLCESGTDLSIGVALALLCLYCNDDGMFLPCKRPGIMGKVFIRGRLSWISTSAPDANPSRATLQSINSFLM
jgi:tRNA A64-2'-O-ribosylphosphate transferase